MISGIEGQRYPFKVPVVVQGGTSAGKTVNILMDKVLDYGIRRPGEIITVVTDSFPNLRTGAMRDFLDICRESTNYPHGTRLTPPSIYQMTH